MKEEKYLRLTGEKRSPQIKQLLEVLARKSSGLFPQVERLTENWLSVIDEVLNNKFEKAEVRLKLLKLAQQISY